MHSPRHPAEARPADIRSSSPPQSPKSAYRRTHDQKSRPRRHELGPEQKQAMVLVRHRNGARIEKGIIAPTSTESGPRHLRLRIKMRLGSQHLVSGRRRTLATHPHNCSHEPKGPAHTGCDLSSGCPRPHSRTIPDCPNPPDRKHTWWSPPQARKSHPIRPREKKSADPGTTTPDARNHRDRGRQGKLKDVRGIRHIEEPNIVRTNRHQDRPPLMIRIRTGIPHNVRIAHRLRSNCPRGSALPPSKSHRRESLRYRSGHRRRRVQNPRPRPRCGPCRTQPTQCPSGRLRADRWKHDPAIRTDRTPATGRGCLTPP